MLNFALTGHPLRGWALGRMSNIIGDKSTGKTLLAMEAAGMLLERPPPGIKKVEAHYVEGEAAFDPEYARSLDIPVDAVKFHEIDTIEEFFRLLESICARPSKTKAGLVVLDSVDSITTKGELDTEMGEGTYGTDKSKAIGQTFRRLVRKIAAANVHLMLISQIRENINRMPFAPKWRRNGGKALDFYATNILWLHEREKYKNKQLDLAYGIGVEANVTKNKVARPFRKVHFPILFDYGIDDLYSLIDFLSARKLPDDVRIHRAKGSGGKPASYNWEPAGGKMGLSKLIETIDTDDSGLYLDLVRQAFDAWDWLEDQVSSDRTSKRALLGDITDDDLEPDPEPEPEKKPTRIDDIDPDDDIPF